MKNDDVMTLNDLLENVLPRLMKTSLTRPEMLFIQHGESVGTPLHNGSHVHETWELFWVMAGKLNFVCGSRERKQYAQHSLIIVPPGCWHVSIDCLKQSSDTQVMIMNLPSEENPYGICSVRSGPETNSRFPLSAEELEQWKKLLGESPRQIMERAVEGMQLGGWGRERALGFFRILFAGYAGILHQTPVRGIFAAGHHVGRAMSILYNRYFDSNLCVDSIAEEVGLSASHLSCCFRRETGRSLHQTLIELRLRRAAELLRHTVHNIGKISKSTGWRNQLYFSAAFRKRYGLSPTEYRTRHELSASDPVSDAP